MEQNSTDLPFESESGGMVTTSIVVPRAMLDEFKRIAEQRFSKQSTVMREALADWLRRQEAAAGV